jgi:acetyl esterase/lipase
MMPEATNPSDFVPPDVEIIRDVAFGRGDERTLSMHIVRPKDRSRSPRPVIVWVYGGAFRQGSKDSGVARLVRFAQRGYLCASIEYRLSGVAKFPAQAAAPEPTAAA